MSDDTALKIIMNPIGVVIGVLWAVCFFVLCVCTWADACEAAELPGKRHTKLSRISEVPSIHSGIDELNPDLPDEENGYASIDAYLQSRYGSSTSD